MFPINIAWDFTPGRKEVLQSCDSKGIGVVGMKIFAGGRLFQRKDFRLISPAQCTDYVLSQPAVSTTVPGIKKY
jgi:predicted aldo/keto reductase-like oxidoreductase